MNSEIQSEFVVSSSPGWFTPNLSTVSPYYQDNQCGYIFLAFSSQKIVNIFKFSVHLGSLNKKYYSADFITCISQFSSSVNVIKFIGDSPLYLIACTSDSTIKIFVYENDQFLLFYSKNTVSDATITALDGIFDQNLKRCIIAWGSSSGKIRVSPANNTSENTVVKGVNESLLQLSWQSNFIDASSLFAVSFKNGYVGVYKYFLLHELEIAKVVALFQLRAHDKEICQLSWACDNDTINLITSGRDRLVKKWSIEDEKLISSYRVPFDKKVKFDSEMPKPWISNTYAGTIVFSNNSGKLFTWSGDSADKPEPISTDVIDSYSHTKIVCNILSATGTDSKYLISVGHDRKVNILNSALNENNYSIASTINCNNDHRVCLATASTSNPVACLGTSDGLLKLLRPQHIPIEKNCDCSMLCIKKESYKLSTVLPFGTTSSGISALCWHPAIKNSSIIALGTESGLVGSFDTAKLKVDNTSKTHSNLQNFAIGSIIYRVVWGPVLFGDREEESDVYYCVYACGKNKIFCQRKPNGPLLDVSNNLNSLFGESFNRFCDITFRINEEEHFIHGLIADTFGKLGIFSYDKGSVRPLAIVKTGQKSVNAITFNSCPGNFTIAIGSNTTFISLVEYNDCIKDVEFKASNKLPILTDDDSRLTGHMNRIVDLEFCPNDANLLLSASYDRTVTIWSVKDKTALSNFRRHSCRLVSAKWSPFEPDFVFSSDEYSFFYGWRPSLQNYKDPPNTRRSRLPVCVSENRIFDAEPSESPSEMNVEEEVAPQVNTEVNKKRKARPRKFTVYPLFTENTLNNQSTKINLSSVPPVDFHFIHCCILHTLGDINGHHSPLLYPIEAALFSSYASKKKLISILVETTEKKLKESTDVTEILPEVLILYLWLGYVERVIDLMTEYDFNPFWLLWCLELSRSYSPFNEQKVDPCLPIKIDLVNMKINSMVKTMDNVYIPTAILVCAGRTLDAVKLLLTNGHVNQAILLSKIRLSDHTPEVKEVSAECAIAFKKYVSARGYPELTILADIYIDNETSLYKSLTLQSNKAPLDRLAFDWLGLAIASSRHSSECKKAFFNEFSHATFLWKLCSIGLTEFQLFSDFKIYVNKWLQSLSGLKSLELNFCTWFLQIIHFQILPLIMDDAVEIVNGHSPVMVEEDKEFYVSQMQNMLKNKPKNSVQNIFLFFLMSLVILDEQDIKVMGCPIDVTLIDRAKEATDLSAKGIICLQKSHPNLFNSD